MDETYIKVRGQWKYLYRAVDKSGDTVDFLLTARRDKAAALRFLRRAVERGGAPAKVCIDRSRANAAALSEISVEAEVPIEIRQSKYLNNIIEQDHRFVKQRARAGRGFKSFRAAQATIQGIELVHMIRKGQLRPLASGSPAEQFNALAA